MASYNWYFVNGTSYARIGSYNTTWYTDGEDPMCVRRKHDTVASYSDEYIEGKRRFEAYFEAMKAKDVYEFERNLNSDWILNNLSESAGITCLPVYDIRFHELARYGWSMYVRHRTPKYPGVSRPKIHFRSPGKTPERLYLHVRAMPILTDEALINLLEDGHFSMAKERLIYARPHVSEYDIIKKMNDERYKTVKDIRLNVPAVDVEKIDVESIVVNLDDYRQQPIKIPDLDKLFG